MFYSSDQLTSLFSAQTDERFQSPLDPDLRSPQPTPPIKLSSLYTSLYEYSLHHFSYPLLQMSDIEIALITPSDIPDAITTIQAAFTDDPFKHFIYDPDTFSPERNRVSLGVRLRWGIANGFVLVAHTPERRCAGVAMWVPPKPLREGRTWWEWSQAWWLRIQQIGTDLRYGHGGLRIEVYSHT